MNVRACVAKLEEHCATARLASLARILFAAYLIGNLSFQLGNFISETILPSQIQLHKVFFREVFRTLLTCVAMMLIFPTALRARLKVDKGAFFTGTALALVVVAVPALTQLILGGLIHQPFPSAMRLAYVLVFSLSAGITEELLCRFVLFDQGRRIAGVYVAFAIQLLIFVYIHIGNIFELGDSPARIAAAGALMCASYLATDSLFAVILFHSLYDIFAMAIFGANLDGAHIFPIIVSDNFAKATSVKASTLFQLTLAALLIGNLAYRRRQKGCPR